MSRVNWGSVLFALVLTIAVSVAMTLAAFAQGWNAGVNRANDMAATQYLRGVYDSCVTIFYVMTGQDNPEICAQELQGAVDGEWFDSPSPGFTVPMPTLGHGNDITF